MESPKSTTVTFRFFQKLCKFIYLCCTTNFWPEEPKLLPKFKKIYGNISMVLEIIVASFIAAQWGSLITQKNMSQKLRGNMWMFSISHTVVYCVYISAVYHRDQIRRVLFTLAVTLGLKDEDVERAMIKKIWWYCSALGIMSSSVMVLHGLEACGEAFTTNATFTTVTTIWPDVEDRRSIAGAARVLTYIVWWIYLIRVLPSYFLILAITICLSHKFISLCNYFLSLNDIFEGDGSQEEKEKRYEDALKVGIKMHSINLWCVRQTQETCGLGFTVQIILNIAALFSMMLLMMHMERSLVALAQIMSVAAASLMGTGVFMWTAGDVTVEADRLPTAMFFSGWHRCQASTVRVRKLVTIALAQAQQPVVIKVLGVVELSYQTHLSIVKASYSLFSFISTTTPSQQSI